VFSNALKLSHKDTKVAIKVTLINSIQFSIILVVSADVRDWQTAGHYGDHPHPQVVDRGMPSRMDKRVAPNKEGAAHKQCLGEGKLRSQYVITNREEGKGKPPRLFPKTG